MKNFLIKVVVDGAALWVATLVVAGLTVSGRGDGVLDQIITFGVLGLLFGLVNAVVKPVVKFFTLPFYILTLGLITFVVNALMLELTSWISQSLPLQLHIDEFFWSAVLGAVVVTFVSMVLNLVLPDRD